MRHLIVVSCAVVIFAVSFSAIYILFRASAPHVRGLVGGGFFLLGSLLLLCTDFVPYALVKKASRTSQVGALRGAGDGLSVLADGIGLAGIARPSQARSES
jgi:hypothetical protein